MKQSLRQTARAAARTAARNFLAAFALATLCGVAGAAVAPFGDPELAALPEGTIRDSADICLTRSKVGRPAALDAVGVHRFRGPGRTTTPSYPGVALDVMKDDPAATRNLPAALAIADFCEDAAVAATGPASSADPDLAAVRAATERFRDVQVALAEGYMRDPMDMCLTAAEVGQRASLGTMGVHYFRPDYLGVNGPPNPRVDGNGTHTDFLHPGVLIYEPQANGSLTLVAVENLVFRRAWDAGHAAPPSFRGLRYELMQDDPATPVDEGHMFAPHYDRHVWLYRPNPNGVFAQFNPNVTCAYHHPQAAHPH